MYEALINTIPNSTFVINGKSQAVEIPKGFHQILRYNVIGKCAEISLNQRYLVGGLNGGVLTDSRIYYTSVPEEESLPDLDIDVNNLRGNNKSDIYITKLPKNTFEIPILKDKFVKNSRNGDCTLKNRNDSYIVQI